MENLTKENVYAKAMESFGVIPGVIKEMVERSVALGFMYISGSIAMESSSLNAVEINTVELKFSILNNCLSCIKGHAFLAKKAGMSEADVQAILTGNQTSSPRINTLIKAAEYIYHSASDAYPEVALDYFEMEGISEQEIMEIIGLMSLKTISNSVNNYLTGIRKYKRVVSN